MKTAFLIVGILVVLLGLHWIGQGTGLFIWPGNNPVMVRHMPWAYYGAATAAVGLILVWFSRS